MVFPSLTLDTFNRLGFAPQGRSLVLDNTCAIVPIPVETSLLYRSTETRCDLQQVPVHRSWDICCAVCLSAALMRSKHHAMNRGVPIYHWSVGLSLVAGGGLYLPWYDHNDHSLPFLTVFDTPAIYYLIDDPDTFLDYVKT